MTTTIGPIKYLEVTGSHFEVGFAIGERFSEQIHQLLDNYRLFQNQILPYNRTPEGRTRYEKLLDLNQAQYPGYMDEIGGLAQGAGRAFEDLFLVNLRGEYEKYLVSSDLNGCSDFSLVTDDVALIGHNEDSAPEFRGNMYLVHADIEDGIPFTALAYPGFLCGNAFGFNAAGVCYSIDNVRPRTAEVGLGRHFVARSLLDAESLDDAIDRVTSPGQALGFSYTIGSVRERRVMHVEVASETNFVHEIQGRYYHANHYLELSGVDQIIGASSQARVERANALLQDFTPLDDAAVLEILGDQMNAQYPIYRTATPPDDLATLYTTLFDLDARRLRIYTGHPVLAPQEFVEFAIPAP
ncbi:MAG: hypothetical protein MAG431_01229 [Chloroflexi bacterium]|nr:hypothetical protein [Chloroflexota bacterium]